MIKKISLFCLVAALAAASGFAQRRGNPPDPQTMIQMRVNFLAAQLGLTDAQKASATTIFTDAYTAGQSIRSSQQDNRQAMAAAIKSNDTATIDTLSATAGNLSGQMLAIQSKAEAAFYALLTADQKAKYDAMPHPGAGGFGGPGGPNGMGPRMRNRPQQ